MDNKKLIRKTMTMLLAFAVAFTMMPSFGLAAGIAEGTKAYAATSAPGGTVESNNPQTFLDALDGGDNASAVISTTGGKTIVTVTLEKNIILSQPLKITQGSVGDKVIINLNGKTLTGAAGIAGTDEYAAMGKSAIDIQAGAFDVEITGPGSVIGGKGAIFHDTDIDFKSGYYGGDAVRFINSSYYPAGAHALLEYGLTVKGGAILTGGDGADVSSTEWLYSIENFSGDRYSAPNFVSGSGGAGIGQENAGYTYDNSISYAKIVVDNGSVSGGAGGSVDMSAITPTTYALMTSSAIATVMNGVEVKNYSTTVLTFPPKAGRGGDGIRIGGGRKYINVGSNAEVNGSSCGSVDFGNNKVFSLISSSYSAGDYSRSNNFHAGDAGNGIAVWVGDIGLTSVEPGFTGNEWQSRTADSDDMGIYVAGTVTGGSTPDTDSLDQSAGTAGAGIALYGDYDRFGIPDAMEYHRDWGIVDIEGTVTGGDGGSAISGSGGDGGYGIFESYDVESNDDGTNHYIVNGAVTGGNGGNSFSSGGLGNAGYFGSGGTGMAFMNHYRENLQVVGNGNVIAGDAGDTVARGSGSSSIVDSAMGAIYLNPLNTPEYYGNIVTVGTTDGGSANAITKSKVTVSATMTKFDTYPTSSTKVSCAVNKPSGYTGKVYVKWFAEIQLQSNDPVICELEPSGTNPMTFNMLSNANYKYLAYPKTATDDLKNYYIYAISTTDRIKGTLEFQNSKCKIYCYVLLEDGRWGKSNVMEFDKTGWSGGGSSGGGGSQQNQAAIDQAAADAVMDMIDNLPLLALITLEDAEAIGAARAAYNALTPAQKALLAPYTYLLDDLSRAEAKIAELRGDSDKVGKIEILINELLDPDDITEDNAETEAAKIAEIRSKIEELTDSQKAMLSGNTEAMEKLASAETAVNEITGSEHVHMMCHVPEKNATCMSAGNIEYYYCITCNDGTLYADENGTTIITGDVETPIDENAHVMNHVNAVPATCKATGVKAHYRCKECLRCFEDKSGITELDRNSLRVPINANAHSYKATRNWNTYYVDYYRSFRTDRCSTCGHTRQVTVRTVYYKKSLPAVKIAKGSAAKKKLTAKWKKVSKKNQKKIAGIEIQVYGPGLNKVYTAGKGKASKAIKVPQAKKKYKYRVRAYKGSGTGKQVSKWSGWKTVKVK